VAVKYSNGWVKAAGQAASEGGRFRSGGGQREYLRVTDSARTSTKLHYRRSPNKITRTGVRSTAKRVYVVLNVEIDVANPSMIKLMNDCQKRTITKQQYCEDVVLTATSIAFGSMLF
jgi:hypothetical protein